MTKADLGIAPHPSRHVLSSAEGSVINCHALVGSMVLERKLLRLMASGQHVMHDRGVRWIVIGRVHGR